MARQCSSLISPPAAVSKDFSVAVCSAIRPADFCSVSFSRVSWALEIGHSQRHSSDRWPSTYTSLRFLCRHGGSFAAKATSDHTTRSPLPRSGERLSGLRSPQEWGRSEARSEAMSVSSTSPLSAGLLRFDFVEHRLGSDALLDLFQLWIVARKVQPLSNCCH
jgi:hypothetical protein